MLNDELTDFVDRHEAIELFSLFRSRRNPNEPWPLMPILAFLGTGGSGKSELMKHLLATECSLPGGHGAAMPYAYMDFTQPSTELDFLSILIKLREKLEQHADELGKHLTFPRFDFGLDIIRAAQTNENVLQLNQDREQRRLTQRVNLLSNLSVIVGSVSSLFSPVISPVLAALRGIGQFIPPLVQHMRSTSTLLWYKHFLHMPIDASISEVRRRLDILSRTSLPNARGREYLRDTVLPAAFLQDLDESLAFYNPDARSRAWNKTVSVVLFLDGFEKLLDDAQTTGIRLLEGLTITEQRKQGKRDPLLLVIGSQKRLFDWTDVDLPSQQFVVDQDEETLRRQAQERAQVKYDCCRYMPHPGDKLNLYTLLIPHWLNNFERAYIRRYLNLIRVNNVDEALAQTVYEVTQGYPGSLAVVKEIFRGRQLSPSEFEQEFERARIAARGTFISTTTKYLIETYLHGLPLEMQRDLTFCAIPRTLNVPILRTVLEISDLEAEARFDSYRGLAIMRSIDSEQLVLDPILRGLLLKRVLPSSDPNSDYHRKHTLLQNYFHEYAARSERQTRILARLEEAYHALALRNPQPAIDLAYSEHQNFDIWEPLLSAVKQAPVSLMPQNIAQRAIDAQEQALASNNDIQASVTSIILNEWLHSAEVVRARNTANILREQTRD